MYVTARRGVTSPGAGTASPAAEMTLWTKPAVQPSVPGTYFRIVKTIFVTGGAGFIGSAVVRILIRETDQAWCDSVQAGTYRGERLGLGSPQ